MKTDAKYEKIQCGDNSNSSKERIKRFYLKDETIPEIDLEARYGYHKASLTVSNPAAMTRLEKKIHSFLKTGNLSLHSYLSISIIAH